MKCVACGAEFEPKRPRAKFCGPKCRKMMVADYYSDKSTKDIAKSYGVTVMVVYKAWHDAGLPKRMTKAQRAVKALRDKGMCCVEIANATGFKAEKVRSIALAIGMPFTDEEKERSIKLAGNQYTSGHFDQIANVKRYIAQYGNFEYVDGFTNIDAFVNIRCNDCGTVTRKSMITIRKNTNVSCAECNRRARESKEARDKEAKRRKAEEDEQQRRIKKFSNIERKQMEILTCKGCGRLMIGTPGRKFCSSECVARFWSRQHGDKRTRKMRDGDRDITLKELYKRDGGVCNGCGMICDWNDFVMDGDIFIAGDNYPSIDHVIPISKGGRHTWDNVQLMCRRCNYLKRDTMPLAVRKF